MFKDDPNWQGLQHVFFLCLPSNSTRHFVFLLRVLYLSMQLVSEAKTRGVNDEWIPTEQDLLSRLVGFVSRPHLAPFRICQKWSGMNLIHLFQPGWCSSCVLQTRLPCGWVCDCKACFVPRRSGGTMAKGVEYAIRWLIRSGFESYAMVETWIP